MWTAQCDNDLRKASYKPPFTSKSFQTIDPIPIYGCRCDPLASHVLPATCVTQRSFDPHVGTRATAYLTQDHPYSYLRSRVQQPLSLGSLTVAVAVPHFAPCLHSKLVERQFHRSTLVPQGLHHYPCLQISPLDPSCFHSPP